jgi:hypothetical protein
LHACAIRECGRVESLSIPHSFSQSVSMRDYCIYCLSNKLNLEVDTYILSLEKVELVGELNIASMPGLRHFNIVDLLIFFKAKYNFENKIPYIISSNDSLNYKSQ